MDCGSTSAMDAIVQKEGKKKGKEERERKRERKNKDGAGGGGGEEKEEKNAVGIIGSVATQTIPTRDTSCSLRFPCLGLTTPGPPTVHPFKIFRLLSSS